MPIIVLHHFCFTFFLICGFLPLAHAASAEHHLEVELIPSEHKLIGLDRIDITTDGEESLTFQLSEKASNISVEINGVRRNFYSNPGRLRLPLKAAERNASFQVTIRYTGIFSDPVPVRPVNMDNPGFGVSASISPTGIFLLSGAHWYPEVNASKTVYNLSVIAPRGFIAVTAGQPTGNLNKDGKTISNWRIDYPVEGLSITAAQYHVRKKQVGGVVAATYFLTADKKLSDAYLEASAGYLKFYSDLFGPYPFQKFAVVENFFPTGYGFPSYTLLGGAVLRLPFIIRTSLGHEIAHCWWGNGVYVDYNGGNWSEALTTYVADYLYKERKSESEGRTYRQQILRNYATLVKPQNDFALARFISRRDPVTKTVGYDKGVMVFHMLRKMTGDEAFWSALRDIYSQRLFKPTSWAQLQQAFEKRSGLSLDTFFSQWVNRKGAPRFHLDKIKAKQSGDRWIVRGSIVQQAPYYSFPAKIMLVGSAGTQFANVNVTADKETAFEITADQSPHQLLLDPDVDIMRQLFKSEVPPAINSLKSSTSVLILKSENISLEVKKAARLLAASLGLKRFEIVAANAVSNAQLRNNDILVIGHPSQDRFLENMPGQIRLENLSFYLNDKQYRDAADVFFGVFDHPIAEDRVAALFLPLSEKNAEIVARKVTHYGKYSYLVFQNGHNREKGFWQSEQSPLIYSWDHGMN
jgi:hypothetical protein